jgi:5,10-methylenetetrahydromethanopterin reductase
MADGMAERQRIGVALRDPLPWRDLAMIVETAEETGFDVAFFPEIPGGRDTLATISGLAANTSSLRLGSGVVALPSRRLSLLAMAAATAHERTGGRLILGLGSGLPGPGSLDRVRAAVAFLRDVFAGNAVDEAGMPFTLNLDPGSAPPIWVAALGDRMVALAGEVADGVLLNWCPPERAHRAAATVADAAARADRDPPEIGVYVRGCLGAEESVALHALGAMAGQYASLPHYRRQLEACGLGGPARAAADALAAGRPGGEELVRALCLVGDPDRAKRRLDEYRDAGAALPILYPVPVLDLPSSIMATMLAVAPSPVLEP